MDDLPSVLNTLVVVGVVAALAPLIVALLPGPRVPQIVLLIIGGIVIGPEGFGLADPAALVLLANIGLGLVFLLAGYELDPAVFGERAGRLALVGWVITVATRRRTGRRPRDDRFRTRVHSGGVGSYHDGSGNAAADPA